jgi:hypothetical protein
MYPLIQKLDDKVMPDSKSLWKEFCKAMRSVEGHNSRTRPTVDKYWATEGAPLEWPKEPIFVIPESDRWPKPKAQKALTAAPATSTGAAGQEEEEGADLSRGYG